MADLRTRISRLCGLVAELGLQRDCEHMHVADCYSSVTLSPHGFTKLLRSYKVRDFEADRSGDFIHAKCTLRSVLWRVTVWSKRASDMEAWQVINLASRPALEVKQPRLAVKRVAIEDKRRPLGLPAPEVIEA